MRGEVLMFAPGKASTCAAEGGAKTLISLELPGSGSRVAASVVWLADSTAVSTNSVGTPCTLRGFGSPVRAAVKLKAIASRTQKLEEYTASSADNHSPRSPRPPAILACVPGGWLHLYSGPSSSSSTAAASLVYHVRGITTV